MNPAVRQQIRTFLARTERAATACACVALLGALSDAQRTVRVSVETSGAQSPLHSRSSGQSISGDGRLIAFWSATAVGPADVYVYDRQTGIKTLASVGWMGNHGGLAPALSVDGRFATFTSQNPLVFDDTNDQNDVYVRDLQSQTTERVSVSSGGAQTDNSSFAPCLSADGRVVAFASLATTLVSGDTNLARDVFVHDRQTATTQRASVSSAGVQGDADSDDPQLSDDGSCAVFASNSSNLVLDDFNASVDVFVRDLQGGATELVNRASNGAVGEAASELGSISGDGRLVVFRTTSKNLVFGVVGLQFYVRDRVAGATALVSQSTGGQPANGGCSDGRICGNGRFVVFSSGGDNLVANDTNGCPDLFLRDLQASTTTRITLTSDGQQSSLNDLYPELGISADGRHALFWSSRSGYVPGDTNQTTDTFVIDVDLTANFAAYATAKTNSLGCAPAIGINGAPYATGFDSCFVIATGLLSQKPGLFFWGRAPANLPFGGGAVYVQPPLVRTPSQTSGGGSSGGDCSGAQAFHFSQSYMASKAVAPGDTCFGQFWTRDPGFAPPNDVGLTDALYFTVAP